MSNPSQRLARWALLAILFACAILSGLSCSKTEATRARRLLRELPPELVSNLVSGDDSALERYGRDTGFETLHGMYSRIGRLEYDLWAAGKKEDSRIVGSYQDRLARVFEAVYGDSSYSEDIAFRRRLPAERRDEVFRLRSEYVGVLLGGPLAPEKALETHTRFARDFESLGDKGWEATAETGISEAYELLGDIRRHKQYLIASCRDYEKLGKTKMTCEMLGRLGSRYERWGQPDSMAICYDRALQIAYAHRMGYQAARILEFYADYYGRLGRLDVKRHLLEQAMDVAREYDPGCYEVRFIKDAMEFHAELGCWDVVETLVDRVRGLERKCADLELLFSEINLLRTDVFDAQAKMAFGDTAKAEEIFRRVNRRLPELHLPATYRAEDDQYAFYRAEGLLSNGRPNDALDEVEKKLSRPQSESTPLWSARLSLAAAEAAYETGRFDEASHLIADFDRFGVGYADDLRIEMRERDALRTNVSLAQGDTAAALAAAAEGLQRLRTTAASVDASAASYLWLTRSETLRQALHAVVSSDALAGYGAEFYWRELYEILGSREREESSAGGSFRSDDMMTAFRSIGRQTLEGVRRLGAVHCVYIVHDSDVWRWTATPSGVRRDILGISKEDLRELIASTTKLMSTYPRSADSPTDGDLSNNLRTLGRALLPPEILGSSGTSPSLPRSPVFLVTTESFLSTIPFETLDVGTGAVYRPLLGEHDVGYVRHAHPRAGRRIERGGVILVNPAVPGGSRPVARPVSVLGQAEEEGEALARIDSSATLLSGASATKWRLMQRWETAPYVYIAAHTVCNLPYLAAIMLAEPGDNHAPDADVLDASDIRAADLHRCAVVVLSGCSSGSPYVAAEGAAPSLGDAFLDAGAEAVVQTFWDVRDEDARRIGTSFIKGWRIGKLSEIHAIAEARREEMRGPLGIRHPSCWASYAVKVSGL